MSTLVEGRAMKIIVSGRDITQEVQDCEDRDEVAILYEDYRIPHPQGEESAEHRQQMNNNLLEAMLKVQSGSTSEEDEDFYYL